MRLTWNILLILLLLSPTLAKLGVFANYIVNQNYYATELCQYKSAVENTCLGSCVFSTEIASLEDTGSDDKKIMQNTEQSFYTLNEFEEIRVITFISKIKNDFLYFESQSKLHIDLAIKPPTV